MGNFDINAFKSNFKNAAKQYLFYVKIDNPAGSNVGMESTMFLVKSSSIPNTTIETIEMSWQGGTYKLPTVQTFAEWTVNFTNDQDGALYMDFVNWMNLMHNPETNEQAEPDDYMRSQTVELLDGTGNIIKTLTLNHAYPTTVGEITLDYSAKEVQTFDVTFTYLWHKYS